MLLFASLSGLALSAQAVPLASIAAIHQLTRAQADQQLPVAFEATVIYCLGYDHTVYVQDAGEGIVVKPAQPVDYHPGDRIFIKGITQGSFRTVIHEGDVRLLHPGQLPRPIPSTFEEMIRGERDAQLVTVHATVRSASLVRRPQAPVQSLYLEMVSDGGPVDAFVNTDDPAAPHDLIDAEVAITGAEGGKWDDKMQQTGILLHVSSLADIQILKRSSVSPWSLPETPMDRILTAYSVADRTQRVRVRGTITYYEPGTVAILQSDKKSLWVSTRSSPPVKVGDVVDATGFPEILNGFLSITQGELQGTGMHAPVEPHAATWKELAENNDRANGHHYDLVSLEGVVVAQVRAAAQDEYVLSSSDGRLFSALFRHPLAQQGEPPPPVMRIPVQSRVRVTGICLPHSADPLSGPVAFDVLLRSLDDISILSGAPWLNLRHMMMVAGVLLIALLGLGARGYYMERRIRQRNAVLAYQEKRRASVLMDINNGRPLAEILERVTELVSARLAGAACWMQIVDGARLGNPPAKGTSGLRIVERPIASRSGTPLGTLYAAIPAGSEPGPEEAQTLTVSAGLATLAIETSRLYHDLVHRSEFDLLTDVQNRFSLEKFLDGQIEDARGDARVFGLLFIDLDRFKQINDEYGHHMGDRYLQEVARRMKRQLRPGDMLARVGGDEFAVVVPSPPGRAVVEEIAARLERCFEDPFHCDGKVLRGSSSLGIAMYPEDGATRDSLMKAADAAMYANKSHR